MRRISSNAFTYVTGFDRGDLPIGLWSMPMTSSIASAPESVSYVPDALAEILLRRMLAVKLGLERAQQHVVHERALAGARDAGHRRDGAERDLDVDALEVVLARAGQRDPSRTHAPPLGGNGDFAAAGEVRAGERALRDARDRPVEDEVPALLAASGPQLDHVIRGANRLGIVLDDEHRVAAVAQAMEQPEQAVHVARMQTDRRFVEHVERVDELRAE